MESYLAVVWGVLLGFAIVMYVILDGPCPAGRCVRISLGRETAPPLVGSRLFLGLDDCKLRPGLCAGWSLAGYDR